MSPPGPDRPRMIVMRSQTEAAGHGPGDMPAQGIPWVHAALYTALKGRDKCHSICASLSKVSRLLFEYRRTTSTPDVGPFRVLAEPTRLELATSAVTGRRSNQLSYSSKPELPEGFPVREGVRIAACSNCANRKCSSSAISPNFYLPARRQPVARRSWAAASTLAARCRRQTLLPPQSPIVSILSPLAAPLFH